MHQADTGILFFSDRLSAVDPNFLGVGFKITFWTLAIYISHIVNVGPDIGYDLLGI